MAFSQKLFTSLHSYSDPDTRIGELNRIWYDSVTNVFRIQLDKVTAGGTIIGGAGSGGYATLTGEETLTNKTLTSPTITDGVFQHTFSIGNQIFYEHGYNGFSVNEDFDIVGEGNFTGYHFTSGAGRDGVAFTLARTGQFTTGFGIHGTAEDNEYVIGSETANTDFVFKKSIGMPFDVSGGTDLFRISNDGSVTFTGKLTFPDGGTLRMATAPTTSKGKSGDKAGTMAVDSTSIFYCIADYVAGTYPTESFTVSNSGINTNVISVQMSTNPNYTVPQAGWTTVINGTTMTLSAYSGPSIDGVNYDFLFDQPPATGVLPSTATFISNVVGTEPDIWVKQAWGTTGSW